MSSSIQWSLHKPLINEGGLQETRGPSSHPERDPECIICHEEIRPKDQTLTHSSCSNTAHSSCLQPWLQEHSYERPEDFGDYKVGTCPMCRQPYSLFDAVKQFFRVEVETIKKRHSKLLDEIAAAIHSLYDDSITNKLVERVEKESGIGTSDYLSVHVDQVHRTGYIKTLLGSAYMTSVQSEIQEWTSRELSALLLQTFEDRLRVLQAITETELSRGAEFRNIFMLLRSYSFATRQLITNAIMLRDGRLNNRRSQIAMIKWVFKQELTQGQDEEQIRAGFKKILKQHVDEVKSMCLAELHKQSDDARLALDTMENMEMVHFFERTGQWLPKG